MRVLMVDDHELVLQGVQTLMAVLAPDWAFETASSLGQALARLDGRRPDLVLLDWHLGDGHGGARNLAVLREAGFDAPVVVLSGDDAPGCLQQALAAGASGFVPKRLGPQAMLEAMRAVRAGGTYLPPGVPAPALESAQAEPDRPRLQELTARQAQIYGLAARGLSNREIAAELGIAESTVKTHLATAFAVMGVRNRNEAAWQAAREGLPD